MPDMNQWGHDLANTFEKLAKKKVPASPYIAFHRDTYLKASATEDWERLEGQANSETSRANKKLVLLGTHQTDLANLYNESQEFVESSRQDWTTLQSRPEWSDIKQRIRADLPAGTSQQTANKYIKELGRLHKGTILARVEQPLLSRAESLHRASVSWLASLMGADLARTIARFNKLKSPTLEPTNSLSSWISSTVTTLKGLEKNLSKAFKKRNFLDARKAADDLQLFGTGQDLEKATRTAAAIAIARHNPNSRWDLGPLARDVGDLIRDLLAAQSLGYKAASVAKQEFGIADEWCDAASTLAFPSAWKAPKAISIAKLWSDPHQYDNTSITVEGIAGPVINKHKRNKVYSSVWIMDAEGNGIRVGVLHIKLDSGGLVEGAYVRATGTFLANDPEFGMPTLRVGRRKLVDDAGHSWKDWTTLRAQEVFTPIPHAFTMSFSWERSATGAANQLRYGSWLPFRTRI